MNYFAVELHSHTNHSDGRFTVDELIGHAFDFGYDAIALTDHNTVSGHEEIEEKGLNQKIPVIKGIEWTTFYGHMLVLNVNKIIDWRKAEIDNIDESIAKVKEDGGLVGIAHPKLIGNPICTGCRWEFKVKKWENVDFIEIFHYINPDERFQNIEAYDLWRGLLKQGYHISPSSGRDWHHLEKEDQNTALTYVGAESDNITSVDVVEAVRKGRMYVTLGPRINVTLEAEGKTAHLGDTVSKGEGTLKVEVLKNKIPKLDRFNFVPKKLRIINMEEIIHEQDIIEGTMEIPLTLQSRYIRVELIGQAKQNQDQRLTITSPIYIEA